MASQKVHDEIKRSERESGTSLSRGEFQCQICRETLSLDPEDERTYLSKTEHDRLFGMQLVTYRVEHLMGEERHVNTIILDHEGYFRGHRDSYTEKTQKKERPRPNHYWRMFPGIPALSESRLFKLAFIIDRRERWVLELVAPENVKVPKLALMAVDRVDEAERVYESAPNQMTIKIADLELEVYLMDSRLLCAEAKSSESAPLIEKFAKLMASSKQIAPIPNKKLMTYALKVIEEHPEFLDHPDLVFHF
ncbi:MAG: hypothetical protein JSW61_01525 [Candidatus Thorarchaeota archaeon]|nr:MAG: hypothetical protein JSW61_01525 [Candidatus Thorarchaeota archaeon]